METRGVLEGEEEEQPEEEEEVRMRDNRGRAGGDREEDTEQDSLPVPERREGDRERPPSYQEAFFFPVLIIHGEESCHTEDM